MKLWHSALLLVLATRCAAGPACAECHEAIYQKQRTSHHAQSLRPFAGSPMALALAAAGVPPEPSLEWAFGAGSQGYTAVGRRGGKYFEYRISWFIGPGRPGVTPGQTGKDIPGVFKSGEDAGRCFRCHSTGLERDDFTTLIPGLTCERCHGPGEKHIAAARARASGSEIRRAIFNASRLPARASVEVCGECHRTRADLNEPVTIRFQPVGLMASACFRKSGVLTCITCHDPHTDAVRHDDGFYVAKCQTCHAVCGAGHKEDCVACHMRRQSLTTALEFTDHRIRIY